jgi:hypothetical protein
VAAVKSKDVLSDVSERSKSESPNRP